MRPPTRRHFEVNIALVRNNKMRFPFGAMLARSDRRATFSQRATRLYTSLCQQRPPLPMGHLAITEHVYV